MKRAHRPGHHPIVAAALIYMSVLATVLSTPAAADPLQRVTVRTFNYAQVPPDELQNARLSAEAIFRAAGVSIRWIDCRVPQGASGAACTEPLGERGDLLLRLIETVPTSSDRVVALGASMLDREQRAGVLMTLDVFPIRAIAAQTSLDLSTLLGRTIAHEMGHLLLGSLGHSRSGLMRGFWSHEELKGLKPAYWRFSRGEAAQIRYGLTAKGRAAN
jgi:hypothetical protein